MNIHRAQEILAADEKIHVELNGLPVWIDSVDPAKQLPKFMRKKTRPILG